MNFFEPSSADELASETCGAGRRGHRGGEGVSPARIRRKSKGSGFRCFRLLQTYAIRRAHLSVVVLHEERLSEQSGGPRRHRTWQFRAFFCSTPRPPSASAAHRVDNLRALRRNERVFEDSCSSAYLCRHCACQTYLDGTAPRLWNSVPRGPLASAPGCGSSRVACPRRLASVVLSAAAAGAGASAVAPSPGARRPARRRRVEAGEGAQL